MPNARNLESPRLGVLLLVEVARRRTPQTAVDTFGQRATRGRVAEDVLRDDAARKHVVRRTGHGRTEMLAQPRGQLAHHKAVGLRAVDNRGGHLHAAHDTPLRRALHNVALSLRVGRVAPPRQAHQRHGRSVAAFGCLIVGIKARGERPRLGVHRLNTQPRGANFGRPARCSYAVVSPAQDVARPKARHVSLKALLQHHFPTAVALLLGAFYQSVLGVENVALTQCNAVDLIFGCAKEAAHRHTLKFRVARRVDARPRAGVQPVREVRRAQRFGFCRMGGTFGRCSRGGVVCCLRTLRAGGGVGRIGMRGRCRTRRRFCMGGVCSLIGMRRILCIVRIECVSGFRSVGGFVGCFRVCRALCIAGGRALHNCRRPAGGESFAFAAGFAARARRHGGGGEGVGLLFVCHSL